jgi:hypothetical protein
MTIYPPSTPVIPDGAVGIVFDAKGNSLGWTDSYTVPPGDLVYGGGLF